MALIKSYYIDASLFLHKTQMMLHNQVVHVLVREVNRTAAWPHGNDMAVLSSFCELWQSDFL